MVCGALLSGCGFHLRGSESSRLPEALSTLRVTVAGSQAAHEPLKAAMQEALRTQAGATVVEQGEVPVLVLSGEQYDRQVLSVSAAGKAAEYLLRYQVYFELRDAKGKELAPRQSLRLQRDYSYDPRSALAKEHEEEQLRVELRRDAVQQILRRLARITVRSNE